MTHHLSADDKLFLKFVDKIQTDDETRQKWSQGIQSNGMTEEIAEEIRKALSTVPDGESETSEMGRGRLLVEFTTLVKRWRLAYQSKNFGRR